MSHRLHGVALLVVLGLLVAGCGGGGSSSSATGESISFRELARSASTSADATSGRFAFDMSMTLPGSEEPFALSGEGAFDEASGRASFAVDMSSLAQLLGGLVAGLAGPNSDDLPDFDDPAGWRIEVIEDGKVGYVRFPAVDDQLPEGKTWIRAEEGDAFASGGLDFDEFEQFAKSDPRELLDALRAVTSEVETVGSEELRGVATTHYRAVIDPSELSKLAPPQGATASQSLVDRFTEQSGLGPVPVDVWIDDTGLVRKLAMAFEATDASTSQSSDVSVSFEIWDYGEAVEIELPPASQVVDAATVRG